MKVKKTRIDFSCNVFAPVAAIIIKNLCFTSFFYYLLGLKDWQQKVRRRTVKSYFKAVHVAALNFSVSMKLLFFSLLALENQFGFCLSWKLIFTAFLLFVSTFKQLLIVFIILSVAEHRRAKTLPKDLPKCTAGHETWIIHQASCFRGATSIEIGVCLLKNLARISRCGPSLVQYLAELVISRSFVSYKSRKGTIEFFEKTTPNVHIIDISRFYF